MSQNEERQRRFDDLKISLLRLELEYIQRRAYGLVDGLNTARSIGNVLDDIRDRLGDIARCEDIVAALHALGVEP